MAMCELCGMEKVLYPTFIEGTTLQVCKPCSVYGKALPQSPSPEQKQQIRQRLAPEPEDIFVENYAQLLKQAREQRGLHQKDVAVAVKEKESIIQKIESGHLQLSMDLAKKLEHFFHLKLLQIYTPPTQPTTSSSRDASLTIGDLVRIRKR